jgi:hypothetical protein
LLANLDRGILDVLENIQNCGSSNQDSGFFWFDGEDKPYLAIGMQSLWF